MTTTTTNNAYVWSPGYVDDLVLRDRTVVTTEGENTTETEERLYAQHDHNFNVTSLVTTSGTVQDRIVYDPYGAWTAYDGTYASAAATRLTDKDWGYLHQGGRQNEINGLYSFRYRELNANLGRWMQQDPAGYVDGGSLYQQVRSSPVVELDPRGLKPSPSNQPKRPKTPKRPPVRDKTPKRGHTGTIHIEIVIDSGIPFWDLIVEGVGEQIVRDQLKPTIGPKLDDDSLPPDYKPEFPVQITVFGKPKRPQTSTVTDLDPTKNPLLNSILQSLFPNGLPQIPGIRYHLLITTRNFSFGYYTHLP